MSNELYHYGVLGMKWGIRKDSYYNPVGRLGNSVAKSMFKKDSSLSGKMSVDEIMDKVVSKINPTQDNNNCTYCSLAYNIRRMGYDVEAIGTDLADSTTQDFLLAVTNQHPSDIKYEYNPMTMDIGSFMLGSTNGWERKGLAALSDDELRKYGDNVYNVVKYGGSDVAFANRSNLNVNDDPEVKQKIEELQKLKETLSEEEYLNKYPDGARGMVSLSYSGGVGHSQAFEIINGSPVIFDCQTNKKYTSSKDYLDFADGISTFASFRLDDKKLNYDLVSKEVKNK